ncbi:flavin reductase family protein [Paraburkholderia sp. A2WS-5]|uniref:flavin reductase family protein n=1 Tax=unclassified Paraburkholderia TaxID=2615204 RepID=UPI003B7A8E5B
MNKPVGLESKVVREAFSHFPSGVAAIAAEHNGKPHVVVASSFSVGVSLEPPLAAFFVQKTSSTWSVLSKAPRLGVSILGVEHAAICRQLASHDKATRFQNVQTEATSEGALHILGAPLWFDCSVFDVHPAGDHYAIQLLIHDLSLRKEAAPLIFHSSRFTQLATATQPACA